MADFKTPRPITTSIAVFLAILAMLMARCDVSMEPSFAVDSLPHSSMSTSSSVAAPDASLGYQHGPAFSPATFSSATATLGFQEPQATTSPSAPAQSAVSPGSAQPLPSTAYILSPTYNPVLGERLPLELQNLVNEYQIANFNLLRLLLKYGLIRGEILGPDGLETFEFQYRDVDDNGMSAEIPYILGGQYMELYDSIHRQYPSNPAGPMEIRRELRHWVEIDIAGRATVNDWHLRLPANDPRVANNPRHAAFLDMLIRLRNRL
jgi:hypothetical protein